ncbi:hypothetical protein [Brachyspira murdochii]|uniref:Lipoprotein n=1 Tax=Brachyspira murdochii (strain ATCC 51284 / DSM 12563 / 56-150) TaxID=526224 RepID=D5UA50_BRAM5|nr:hypothetical protein [Brachyspira murdochii]ADG71573.1 conserved hypothetical protein [Brachyspira murdochii DSM 12563]
MNKKLLSILFTLFLSGILSVSCSNADKTAQGTGIDSKYAGTWLGGGDLAGQTIIINADGSAQNQTEGVDMPASSITKNSDTSYTVNYTLNPSSGFTVKGTMNIEFTTDTSANVTGQNIITYQGGSETQNINGTLTKQQQ